MSKTDQITVIVQTPLKRGGQRVQPGTSIDLPTAEAEPLVAVQAVRVAGYDSSAATQSAPASTNSEPGLVNVNTATPEQIAEAAKGIGIHTARDVVKWRKASGPFAHLDDLAKVGGIGKATVQRNQGVLTV